jgi:hypothetical protein
MISDKQLKELIESCSMVEFEYGVFEASLEDLKEFAERIIDIYENQE